MKDGHKKLSDPYFAREDKEIMDKVLSREGRSSIFVKEDGAENLKPTGIVGEDIIYPPLTTEEVRMQELESHYKHIDSQFKKFHRD